MLTSCFRHARRSRLRRYAFAALTVAMLGLAATIASPADAQNLVTNGTFAITGGTSSFWFGGYSQWGGSESLGGWSFIPAGANNIGAGFDFANGTTSACYGGSSGCSTTSGADRNIEQILPSATSAPTGANFIAIAANWGGNTQNSGVTQTVTGLTVGTTYKLSFSYAVTQWSAATASVSGSDSAAFNAILGSSTIAGDSQFTPTDTVPYQGFSGWATATFYYVANATSETLQLLASGGSGQPPLALLANVSLTSAPEPMGIAIFGTGLFGLAMAARSRRGSSLAR